MDEKDLVCKAITRGSVVIDPAKQEVISRIDLCNPDTTLTSISLDSCWGEYHRLTKDGKPMGNKGGFSIEWETVSAGCGRIVFYINNDGTLRCQDQGMDKNFIMNVLEKLVDQSIME